MPRPALTFEQIIEVVDFVDKIMKTFEFDYKMMISTKPEKAVGDDEVWEISTNALKTAMDKNELPYEIDEGGGAFYGPKIDIKITDAIGREWQCGTIQLDMSLPERFNLYYIDKDNQKHRPIMIHRTIFGSIERFLGILIEHFAGKFPIWMAPTQAIILPINDDLVAYSTEVLDILKNAGLRVEIDSRTESLNKKIRDAQLNKIPLILTIGKKEKESKTLSVRTLDGSVKYGITHEDFIERVLAHINQRKLTLDIF